MALSKVSLWPVIIDTEYRLKIKDYNGVIMFVCIAFVLSIGYKGSLTFKERLPLEYLLLAS